MTLCAKRSAKQLSVTWRQLCDTLPRLCETLRQLCDTLRDFAYNFATLCDHFATNLRHFATTLRQLCNGFAPTATFCEIFPDLPTLAFLEKKQGKHQKNQGFFSSRNPSYNLWKRKENTQTKTRRIGKRKKKEIE